ncbi:hypothetical protein GY45DRAFT_1370218 [Cubamyces sp. BRFM 1775]|nr:hypothetical protein GY45DRAFT_1370218 [Cubamyces sp. BRFM 1775]
MTLTASSLLTFCVTLACAESKALLRTRAEESSTDGTAIDSTGEGVAPDGHLTQPWVVAMAVSFAVVICLVVGVILVIKWRQRRRRQASREGYVTSGEQLRRARPTYGPYGFSTPSTSRSPSPPSPAHLSEKGYWAPLPPQR